MASESIVNAIKRGCDVRVQVGRKWGQLPKLLFSIDGHIAGHVTCLVYDPPTARPSGTEVVVRSSNVLRGGGFRVPCESEQDASHIAEMITLAIRAGLRELGQS